MGLNGIQVSASPRFRRSAPPPTVFSAPPVRRRATEPPPDTSIVLGLDPGTARTGYGLIAIRDEEPFFLECGCLVTTPQDSRWDRLRILFDQLTTLLDRVRPGHVVVEELFFNRNVNTAMAVGEARGVILLAAAQRGLGVTEFTPGEAKEAVTGYGSAKKNQVREAVMMHLSLTVPPRPDDASDALALALCHHFHARLNGA